jgi:apolipoprotein N-acyltransferase
VLHNVRRRNEFVSEQVFIALYAAGMLAAVAATSLETRHIGQFLPAFILLAAMPDTRQRKERRRVATMRFTWIAILGAVHLAWAGVRFL